MADSTAEQTVETSMVKIMDDILAGYYHDKGRLDYYGPDGGKFLTWSVLLYYSALFTNSHA